MTSQTFSLDLIPKGIPPVVYASQYDKGQTWGISILKDGSPFSIPVGSAVTVQGTKSDGMGFQYACTFSGSVVTVTEEQQMTVLPGDVPTEIRIAKDDDIIGTLNFIIRVEPAALADDTIISETELPLIERAAEIVSEVDEIVAEVEAAASGAADSALDAEAWAVGTRDGVPVESDDPAYQHNSKYYADNFVGMITDAQWASITTILQ